MKAPRATAKNLGARQAEGRTDILEAAAYIIARNGFHGMGMRDLAHRCGKALASLYNYFASKEDVLFALQAGAFESLVASAQEAVDTHDAPAEQLYGFILNHVRYVVEHTDAMRVLVHEASALPSSQRRRVRELKERYYAVLEPLVGAIVAENRATGSRTRARTGRAEVERATYSVFGMLNWVYAWYQPDVHGSPSDVARTIHRLTLCGLSAPRNPQFDLSAVEARINAQPPQSLIRVLPQSGGI